MIYIYTDKENHLCYKIGSYGDGCIHQLGVVQNKKGIYKLLKGKGYKRTAELEAFVENVEE